MTAALTSSVGTNTVPVKSGSDSGVRGPTLSTAAIQDCIGSLACARGVSPGRLDARASSLLMMPLGGRGSMLSRAAALWMSSAAAVEGEPEDAAKGCSGPATPTCQ